MENKYKHIENLVLKAKSNDKDSLIELYNIFLPCLKHWYSKIYLKEYTFEDISQEYFFWLTSAIDKYNGGSSFAAYIRNTIKNNLFMLLRKKNYEILTDFIFLLEDNFTIDDFIINKIYILNVIDKTNKLSDIEKTVIKNYYFNDLSLKEISEKFNIKYSTVAKIKTRSLQKLYKIINQNNFE